jgi:beta-lactamase superfamily II metal-dependent hydrolase
MRVLVALTLVCAGWPAIAKDKPLNFYFIDVEGGQSTLIVTPSKQSILVDAGWPGRESRDAKRIKEAARLAGVKRIDYMLTTHYHTDHVGGVPEAAALIPMVTFVDHGENNETSKTAKELSDAYERVASKGKRLKVNLGDKIPLKGVELTVVATDGNVIDQPLPGAGKPNPLCEKETKKAPDNSENARSIGFMLTYGKFRFVNLADLTWNKELDLACAANKLGEVDVYLSTHHGMDMSGPAAIVHALNPRAAIMNNGAKKGGTPSAWRIIRSAPRLEDLWQLHFAIAGGKDTNSPDVFIANTDEICQGKAIHMAAMPDGSFTITNLRNKHQKTYAAR